VGSIVKVLLQMLSDSDSETSLTIGQYYFDEVKAYEIKAYKKCASFFSHPIFSGRAVIRNKIRNTIIVRFTY